MATEYGCSGANATNVVCLCSSQNFRFGIRDCVAESCPASDASTVTTFGNQICAGAYPLVLLNIDYALTDL